MKALTTFFLLGIGLAATAGCSSSTTDDTTDGGATPTPSASTATPQTGPGDFAADYKTSDKFFTAMAKPVAGSSPHKTVKIWYSSNLKDLVGKDTFTAPEGSVSIKEFDMEGDGKVDGLAVMIKKAPGYDAANGDWYYDMRSPDGKVMADPPAGKIAMCIGCHAGFKSKDYLGGTSLK